MREMYVGFVESESIFGQHQELKEVGNMTWMSE